MNRWVYEIEGVSIVLLGSFTPTIFHPAWFAHHGLIRTEEAENAEQVVAFPDLATFAAAWLTIRVTSERFEASTADAAHFEALRDVVLGTFRLLEQMRFDRMGLNRSMHCRTPSEGHYVEIGHRLVPNDPWKRILENPRTRSVAVEGTQLRGEERVKVTVKVEPSTRVSDFGVYIATNEHYEMTGTDAGRRLMMALQRNWEEAQIAARQVAERLLGQVG